LKQEAIESSIRYHFNLSRREPLKLDDADH